MKTEYLVQWSPTFLAPGTSLMEDNFSIEEGRGMGVGWGRTGGDVSNRERP